MSLTYHPNLAALLAELVDAEAAATLVESAFLLINNIFLMLL